MSTHDTHAIHGVHDVLLQGQPLEGKFVLRRYRENQEEEQFEWMYCDKHHPGAAVARSHEVASDAA